MNYSNKITRQHCIYNFEKNLFFKIPNYAMHYYLHFISIFNFLSS